MILVKFEAFEAFLSIYLRIGLRYALQTLTEEKRAGRKDRKREKKRKAKEEKTATRLPQLSRVSPSPLPLF